MFPSILGHRALVGWDQRDPSHNGDHMTRVTLSLCFVVCHRSHPHRSFFLILPLISIPLEVVHEVRELV